MCGRITLSTANHLLAGSFFLDEVPDLEPRYNICPTQEIAAVVPNPNSEGNLIRMFQWGLVPPWAKGQERAPKMINARSETVLQKASYKEAFSARRCLIPVDGFFEWQTRNNGKQPFLFMRKDKQPFALAGIWESWEYPGGKSLVSCTILTTKANSLVRTVHHRMPVILADGSWKQWLNSPAEKAESLLEMLVPAPAETYSCWPVSRKVNHPDYDQPDILDQIWDDQGGQLNLFG